MSEYIMIKESVVCDYSVLPLEKMWDSRGGKKIRLIWLISKMTRKTFQSVIEAWIKYWPLSDSRLAVSEAGQWMTLSPHAHPLGRLQLYQGYWGLCLRLLPYKINRSTGASALTVKSWNDSTLSSISNTYSASDRLSPSVSGFSGSVTWGLGLFS